MTTEQFQADVKNWLATAKDHRWKRPYPELTYQPMQEVSRYFRANGYKTYIVTGGGQDFVRVYSEEVYGIPPEQVVGRRGCGEVWLRQGWQADPDQRAQAPAQRQRCGQARGHPPGNWSTALRGIRQFDRRPANARIHQSRRRWRGSRCSFYMTTQSASMPTARPKGCRQQGGYIHPAALRRGEEGWLVGHQHEKRLEAHFLIRELTVFVSARVRPMTGQILRDPS